jgi:hypothetical protein
MFLVFVFVAFIVTSLEHDVATVIAVQFATDSVFKGAFAETVITSAATRPEIPDNIHAPAVTLVVFNTAPFL